VNYYYKNITVNKVWDDNNNSDLVRPSFVTVRLLRNGEILRNYQLLAVEGWKCGFYNLPIYDDEGNEYDYTIEEIVPDNYICNITNASNNFTIVNTLATNSLNITKIWDDADDVTGKRPDEQIPEVVRQTNDASRGERTRRGSRSSHYHWLPVGGDEESQRTAVANRLVALAQSHEVAQGRERRDVTCCCAPRLSGNGCECTVFLGFNTYI
jgi:hypothetical protein